MEKTERQDIWKDDWDVLIVLDACRYDYFEKKYKDYFKKSELKKVKSFSECAFRTLTIDWLCKNFTKFYEDIIFISSNPIVNSRVEWKEKKKGEDKEGLSFSGRKHFFKVIDVWDFGWDNKFGTVFPEKVCEALLREKKKNPGKRFILDFMQPHFPYIGEEYRKYFLKKEDAQKQKEGIFNRGKKKKMLKTKVRSFFAEFIKDRLGDKALWKIMKWLKIRPKSSWTMIGIAEGIEGIKRAYEENLDFVMKDVSELTKKLKGKIVITADHGEYLGESGKFGHGKKPPHSQEVIEVPWLVINNGAD